MRAYGEIQQDFWRRQVLARPLSRRLAYIESHFPGSFGCGWEEGIYYPLPAEDARILQALWEETYLQVVGRPPEPDEGPAPGH